MTADLATLTPTDARSLTDQIKVGVEAVWQLVTRAYTERAWDALGYSSWDDYCTREFGTSRLRLPREERSDVVSSLRESGLSLRAIASATGYDEKTIRNTLTSAGAENSAPVDPEPVAPEPDADTAQCIHCGTTLPLAQLYEGGQGYECDPCVSTDAIEDDPQPPPEQDVTDEPETAQPPVITGIDGKKYPQPTTPKAPPAPRRTPLVDTARNLGLDVAKLTKRIEDFVADDRLDRNKNEVAPRLRHHLESLTKVCQDLNHHLSQGD